MTDIEIVRGEIQPWTDYTEAHPPAGGPALLALLTDLLPATTARTLIVGPHAQEVIELAASRSAHLTVLVRSVSDAVTLRSAVPAPGVTVVAGALDGLPTDPYDVVLAADGLDRVLGYDSPALNWPQRAALVSRLAAPGALTLIAVENEFALTALYDRRPVDERHGDEEWRPLHDDPSRPTSLPQISATLSDVRRTYASFADTLLDAAAAGSTRPGRLGARLAVAGLAASAAHVPLLAPVADGAEAAARAGLLDAVAPGWLVVCGEGGPTRTAYTSSLGLDLGADGWRTTGGALIPDTESAETLLFRLAAAEDVPGFRALAARLGAWADGPVCFDDVHPDGDGFTRGIFTLPTGASPASPASTASTPEALAAAWYRLRDRLVHGHRRHPWPPWMVDGDDLVTAWLAMSGVEADADLLAHGRKLADAIAADVDIATVSAPDAGPDLVPPGAGPDLRTALADAETARVKAVELAGQIFGLERTMRFRDQQLRTREQQLRTMRDELRGLKGSRAMQLSLVIRKAGKIRHPKQLARGIKRRLRQS